MFNKSLAFGFLAAGLMIVPGTAFADSQRQDNVQITTQQGSAIGSGVNAQSADTLSIQNQVKLRQRRAYKRLGYCPGGYSNQSQTSTQASAQNGGAIDYSDNAQASSSVSEQNQVVVSNTGCYR